jgi:hypothetical protein
MDPFRNPFAPGAGTQPPELAGRQDVLRDAEIALERIKSRAPARSEILVGLRGVGKTVLLNRIREMASERGFETVLLEAREKSSLPELLVPALRKILLRLDSGAALHEKTKLGLRILKSFMERFRAKITVGQLGDIELGVEAERGLADSGDMQSDLTDVLVGLAEAASEANRPVCVLLDELQYFKELELSALIMAVHQINQRNLPFLLIAAGLPLVLGLTGRSKSYAERLFAFPSIGALSQSAASAALSLPVAARNVAFTEGALQSIYKSTEGYPYFIQQWGYEVWNVAPSSPITEADVALATGNAIRQLDESFFRVRFDRLTKREKDYLFAMVSVGGQQQRSGDIAERLGFKASSIGPLRSSLIAKGMIFSPSHGDNAFTVPLFDGFLRRQLRADTIQPIQLSLDQVS